MLRRVINELDDRRLDELRRLLDHDYDGLDIDQHRYLDQLRRLLDHDHDRLDYLHRQLDHRQLDHRQLDHRRLLDRWVAAGLVDHNLHYELVELFRLQLRDRGGHHHLQTSDVRVLVQGAGLQLGVLVVPIQLGAQ